MFLTTHACPPPTITLYHRVSSIFTACVDLLHYNAIHLAGRPSSPPNCTSLVAHIHNLLCFSRYILAAYMLLRCPQWSGSLSLASTLSFSTVCQPSCRQLEGGNESERFSQWSMLVPTFKEKDVTVSESMALQTLLTMKFQQLIRSKVIVGVIYLPFVKSKDRL